MGAIWQTTPIQVRILSTVALAMILGAVIGLEREAEDKPAGLRTYMLVVALSQVLSAIGVIVLAMVTLRGVGLPRRWLPHGGRE